MYNEIWKSVEALFKPLHRMADIIAIPELTFELIGVLRINLKDSEYADTSKYKRVIKQELLNPEYQIVNIIFDYEDENANYKLIPMMYEGKITLFSIIPYKYITAQNSLDGPIPYFMLNYLFMTRSMLGAMIDSPFVISPGSGFLKNISLHSIPVLFTKWMTTVFGMDKSTVETIIKVLEKEAFPAKFNSEHINIYIDLLMDSTVEQILDYGYIATEEVIIKEAFLKYLEEYGKEIEETKVGNDTTEDVSETGKQHAEDISAD